MNQKPRSRFNNFEEYIIMVMFAVMSIVMALQVFFRKFLNMPLVWSEELIRYLFVWATMLGAGYGVKEQAHISMLSLVNVLPAWARKAIAVLFNVIAIVTFALILPDAIRFTILQNRIDSAAMQIPMSFLIAAVPVGITILIFRLVLDIIRQLKTNANEEEGMSK